MLEINFPFRTFGEELNVNLQAFQIEVALGFEGSKNCPAYECKTVLHAHM